MISKTMIHSLLLFPDSFVYRKEHGVSSGSGFTNLVDSLVNHGCMQACASIMKIDMKTDLSSYLGDDAIIYIRDYNELERLQYGLAGFGLIMHPEKCIQDLVFLSRRWNRAYGEAKDSIFPRLLCPEKPRNYGSLYGPVNVIAATCVSLG
jgi:hypothetical protein